MKTASSTLGLNLHTLALANRFCYPRLRGPSLAIAELASAGNTPAT